MGLTGTDPALMYAISGVARSGATRSGYHSAEAFITIGGVQVGFGKADPAYSINYESLSIEDVLNEQPNRCSFSITGIQPTVGQEVIIMLGSKSNGRRLFAGHILQSAQRQVALVSTVHYDVSAVDYTWQLGFLKVTAFFAEQSATPIAQSLISAYAAANGFTANNVQAGLPTVPGGITFTEEDLPNALTRLATRIGGYWYVDYFKDIHFFLTDTAQTPTDLTSAHLTVQAFQADVDLSQSFPRAYVEGRGSTILGAVLVGDTRIPVVSVDMFQAGGGIFAKVSFQGSDGGAQHLIFAGVVVGGSGSLVGPGIGPGAAPSLAAAAGTGLGTGLYRYAVTFITALGESLPSPTGSVTTGFVTPPAAAASWGGSGAGSLGLGNYTYAFTFVTAGGETTASPTFIVHNVAGQSNTVTGIVPGPSGTTGRKLYRTVANGAQLKLVATIADNTTTSYSDTLADGSLGANVPTSNTAPAAQVDLANVPIGGTGVTQRKVYRTVVGGSQLKLLTTIADNTTTTYLDAIADGSLGANVPTSDTSGLTQPDGQINAGAPSIVVAGAGTFEPAGGWAVIGNGEQAIRYTAITSGSLSGIPASGVGAITATIAYNSTVTAAPMLTGIPASGPGSIQQALSPGDEVYVVVQRDNTTAQATLASRLGGNGIREEWIQDRRLSIPEATARGDAFLASRPLDAALVSYTCKDLITTSGPTITVNLGAPTNVVGVFRIQRVTINGFTPALRPTFTVEASAQRWSFEDLLRLNRSAA